MSDRYRSPGPMTLADWHAINNALRSIHCERAIAGLLSQNRKLAAALDAADRSKREPARLREVMAC